jgi:serine/threonine protein kinase
MRGFIRNWFVLEIRGIQVLHSMKPPVAHRDLKIENVLMGNDGNYKLIDFGSCTTEVTDFKYPLPQFFSSIECEGTSRFLGKQNN